MNFSKVMLGGRLTADPELRQTTSGTSVCSFTVAVNRFNGKDADFFDCTAFGERAELVARSFLKGSNIFVCGRLQQDRFKDRDGNNRSKVITIADEVIFVDKKETDPAFAPPQSQEPSFKMGETRNGTYYPYAKAQAGGQPVQPVEPKDDPDLPF